MKDGFVIQPGKVNQEFKYSTIKVPVYLWRVTIPKNGAFQIHYKIELTRWQRLWMKFIGWGVDRYSK